MPSTADSVSDVIELMRENGKAVPRDVPEISDFPFDTHESLLEALRTGKMILQRFSFQYDFNLFSLLASRAEVLTYYFFLAVTYLSPIVAIVLGFMFSWWWILLAPLGIWFGMRGTKATYNKVIFSSALRSEIEFCFLYFLRQISVTSADYIASYYWKE